MAIDYLTSAQKNELFGHIAYVVAPTPAMPEGIRITNGWSREHLTRVEIPQLADLARRHGIKSGFPKTGVIFWNKAGTDSILVLFREIERRGLLDRVLTWGGTWAPRFIRNNHGVLSSHAWATAFDVNVAWNGLGRDPAPIGSPGSVRELVPIAEDCGFYWGGNFSRKDGMHFELADLDRVAYVERS